MSSLRRLAWTLPLALAAWAACAQGDNSAESGSSGSGGDGGSGSPSASSSGSMASSTSGGGGAGGFNPTGGGGGALPDGCAAGSDFMYIVGFGAQGSMLYSFDPAKLTFQKLGPLVGCPPGIFSQGGAYPVSMALDRDANAWVLYYDGGKQDVTDRLYKVDTKTITCTDTGQDLTHPSGPFTNSGLAFLQDPADNTKEILYASLQHGMGASVVSEIGIVDIPALSVVPLAPTDATIKITSTGDGHIFGYGAAAIYEIDPKTGSTLSKLGAPLPFYSFPGNAFAFWGGSFWNFQATSADPDTASTTVFQIDPKTDVATEVSSVDLYVTGAGVSTCAPIEPPSRLLWPIR